MRNISGQERKSNFPLKMFQTHHEFLSNFSKNITSTVWVLGRDIRFIPVCMKFRVSIGIALDQSIWVQIVSSVHCRVRPVHLQIGKRSSVRRVGGRSIGRVRGWYVARAVDGGSGRSSGVRVVRGVSRLRVQELRLGGSEDGGNEGQNDDHLRRSVVRSVD